MSMLWEAVVAYLAYMLRLWSSEQGGRRVWRVSLESAHSLERHMFPDLDALFAFLRQQTERLDDLEAAVGPPPDTWKSKE